MGIPCAEEEDDGDPDPLTSLLSAQHSSAAVRPISAGSNWVGGHQLGGKVSVMLRGRVPTAVPS